MARVVGVLGRSEISPLLGMQRKKTGAVPGHSVGYGARRASMKETKHPTHPCPCCGDQPRLVRIHDELLVECDCNSFCIEGQASFSAAEAIAQWNSAMELQPRRELK
jgi:hypothetical protein